MNVEGLRKFVVAAFILLFAAVYIHFFWVIWSAEAETVPDFNNAEVAVAAVLSGALGSAFAVAMGVSQNTTGIRLGLPNPPLKDILLMGIVVYAVIGFLAIATYLFRQDQTPETIATIALVILGYMAAIVTNAYRAVLDP